MVLPTWAGSQNGFLCFHFLFVKVFGLKLVVRVRNRSFSLGSRLG